MTPYSKNTLSINQLRLDLYLGWPDDERLRKQAVMLDLDIHTPTTPKACATDHLDDTCCYRVLIESLRNKLTDQKFHLIEHVTFEIYRILKEMVPADTKLAVRLSKCPQIEGLGSVTFHYCDEV